MASNDLVFSAAPLRTGDLVFGDDGSNPATDAIVSGVIDAGMPQVGGRFTLGVLVGGGIDAGMPVLAGTVRYFTDTQRPLVSKLGVRFQEAEPIEAGTNIRQQDGVRTAAAVESRYADGLPVAGGVSARFQDGQRVRRAARLRFKEGTRASGSAGIRYQDAARQRVASAVRFQDARGAGAVVDLRFRDGVSVRRASDVRFQEAQAFFAGLVEREGFGMPINVGRTTRYQNAIKPPPGVSRVEPPKPPDPCYVPDANLLFEAPWSADTNLVFVCERHDGPGPGETVVVPIKRVYVVENHITLHRVDTGAAIEADAFSMSLDVDSWTWSWSASLPAGALALIEPNGDGDPVDIETMVNGVAFRLCAESYSRERSFGKARIRVQGRGRGAILDEPYAPTLNHFSASAMTAQQLAALALTINGVGIGWDVAWGLEDWFVPGGTWNVQGSYIAAVQDIVRAAGGYVQPHRTATTLRVLPRYPAAPWAWNTLTPDFELPSAIASVEGIEWRNLPGYDRVFVGGTTSAGVLGQVTRAGTAGGAVAPMVTHPLITSAIAARQRGLADLANTGRQALVTLRMPVLADTGIIQPGALVRYVDGPTTRLGLVRSTSVSWDRPVLRQTISLETHVG